MRDYYYILGISDNASEQEIKTAYRKLSLKFHPDKNNGEKFFEERFKQIQEAYEALSTSANRKLYDERLYQFKSSRNNRDNLKSKEEELRRKFEEQLKEKEEEIRNNYQNRENKIKEEFLQKQKNSSNNKHARSEVKPEQNNQKTLYVVLGIGFIIVIFLLIFNILSNRNNIESTSISNENMTPKEVISKTSKSIEPDTTSNSQIEMRSYSVGNDVYKIPLSEVNEFLQDFPHAKPLKHNVTIKLNTEGKWQEFYENFKIGVANKDKELISVLTSKDFFDGGGGYTLTQWLDSMVFVNDQTLREFKAELNKKILDDTNRDGDLLKTTGNSEHGGYLFFIYEKDKWLFGGVMGD